MRVLLVGATGVVGRAVGRMLKARHEVVEASRIRAAHHVDITDNASIEALLESVNPLDAIVATAGEAHFGAFAATSLQAFEAGVRRKLLGQVQLVLAGQDRLRDGGSVTLTSAWPAYGRHFPGLNPVDAEQVAEAYRRSVEGSETGQIYAVY